MFQISLLLIMMGLIQTEEWNKVTTTHEASRP